ncbi:MAG TPA: hypothetical protein VGE74_26625, partial [Gemmata sp.]
MPALFFPTSDALRLALASGLVPGNVTGAPGRAGRDEAGRLWVELDELPGRDTLSALGRFGVVAQGGSAVSTHPIRCWAELVPLRKCLPPPGPVLFSVTDKQLGSFVARLRRLHAGPLGVRLLPDPHTGCAWVTALTPPVAVLLWSEEPESPVRAYRQQAPGVWVARGWEHPLAGHLAFPHGYVLLCAPESPPAAFPGPVPAAADDEIALPQHTSATRGLEPVPRIEVRLRLSRAESGAPEALWVLGPNEFAAFSAFCCGADERLLRRFHIATVEAAGKARVLIRHAPEAEGVGLPVAVAGYLPDPRVAGLFVPAGFSLRPKARESEIARELGLAPDRLTWLEVAPQGAFTIHSAPVAAFRPLCDALEYVAPEAVPLAAVRIPAGPFPFATFAPPLEPVPEPEPVIELASDEEPARGTDNNTWVSKSVKRLVRWVQGRAAPEPGPAEPKRPRAAEPPSERVEQKLRSADALLHGHDRAAHRHDLETRLLADFPRLGPDERAARWAELASVYGATGQALDAAVCWVNALWECPVPPAEWLTRWAESERAAARPGDRTADLERWLAEPGRPGTGRVVAALAACAGFHPAPPEFARALPRVLAVLDQHFEDTPVRGAWLARLAVARACNGDALGLARWRDRIVHRLRDRGPGLDLDEPSFLRFRGTATADRFKTAREWLTHMK